MKKILGIIVLSLLLSGNAYAQWIYINSGSINDNGINLKLDKYFENASIKKKGGYTYAWTLINFDRKTKYGERSIMSYQQIDCDLMRSKDVQVITKSGSMGNGQLIETYNDVGGWKAAIPGTSIETELNKICAN